MIGQFSHDGIDCLTGVKFVSSQSLVGSCQF